MWEYHLVTAAMILSYIAMLFGIRDYFKERQENDGIDSAE